MRSGAVPVPRHGGERWYRATDTPLYPAAMGAALEWPSISLICTDVPFWQDRRDTVTSLSCLLPLPLPPPPPWKGPIQGRIRARDKFSGRGVKTRLDRRVIDLIRFRLRVRSSRRMPNERREKKKKRILYMFAYPPSLLFFKIETRSIDRRR